MKGLLITSEGLIERVIAGNTACTRNGDGYILTRCGHLTINDKEEGTSVFVSGQAWVGYWMDRNGNESLDFNEPFEYNIVLEDLKTTPVGQELVYNHSCNVDDCYTVATRVKDGWLLHNP